MSALLEQLAAIFNEQGWTYTLDPDQDCLSTAFSASDSASEESWSLVLRPLAEQAVLIEVLSLATLDAGHAAALPVLARHMPEISLVHDPTAAEVRAQFQLPVTGASVTAEAVQTALGSLFSMATVLRPALVLMQQGVAAEDALQRAQEALSATLAAEERQQNLRERLLAANSKEAIAILVEEWPEVLAPDTLARLNDAVQALQHDGQSAEVAGLNQVQAWLAALRQECPLLVAIFAFIHTDRWDHARDLARTEPLLHDTDALAQLDILADRAGERGEKQLAAHYREHRQRLATWQANGFAPEEGSLSVPEALRASLQELTDLQNKNDRTSLERRCTLCQALLARIIHKKAQTSCKSLIE